MYLPLLFYKYTRDGGTLDLHGADRAEFLTAEAAYAVVSVYDRLAVFNYNGFRRTDIFANAAADAQVLIYLWL